jgi:hypothetical protein
MVRTYGLVAALKLNRSDVMKAKSEPSRPPSQLPDVKCRGKRKEGKTAIFSCCPSQAKQRGEEEKNAALSGDKTFFPQHFGLSFTCEP